MRWNELSSLYILWKGIRHLCALTEPMPPPTYAMLSIISGLLWFSGGGAQFYSILPLLGAKHLPSPSANF